MAVSIELIKQLRDMTSASVTDCKKALDEARGDIQTASDILKKRGLEIAQKKASRVTNQGRIEAYVHTGNKIGVLVEVNCETDFVARNEAFIQLARDVAMQVAATDPKYLKAEDVPADAMSDLDEKAKKDYIKTQCLLSQPFIKDEKVSIQEYVTSVVAKIGENIVVRRFCRFKLGDEEK